MGIRATIFDRLLLYVTALVVVLCGCAPALTRKELEQRYGLQAPAVLKYGAVDRLKSGQTWRVFVAAEDPDGDMDAVVFRVYQPGTGWYPAHFKKLREAGSRSFSGYFFLNTPGFWTYDMWGLRLTLTFEIRDKAGHRSDVITLPLQFVGKKIKQPVPEGFTEVDVRSLGPIMIDFVRENNGGDNQVNTGS